jgi:hypothetical protein
MCACGVRVRVCVFQGRSIRKILCTLFWFSVSNAPFPSCPVLRDAVPTIRISRAHPQMPLAASPRVLTSGMPTAAAPGVPIKQFNGSSHLNLNVFSCTQCQLIYNLCNCKCCTEFEPSSSKRFVTSPRTSVVLVEGASFDIRCCVVTPLFFTCCLLCYVALVPYVASKVLNPLYRGVPR